MVMDRTGLEDLQEIRVNICIPRRLQECGPPKLAKLCLLLGDDEVLAVKVTGQAVVFLAQVLEICLEIGRSFLPMALQARADLRGNIRSGSEYGFATASFIGHEHLEPLDLWGESGNLTKNAV
jgi:hypothetical protein